MADLGSITAVRPTTDTEFELVTYGATVAAGNAVYLDAADNEHKLADNDDTLAKAAVVGVAMTPGVDGGFGIIATAGSIILVGTTAAIGETYYVSSTAGGLAPDADLTSGEYVSRVGAAESATQIKLSIQATGIAHA